MPIKRAAKRTEICCNWKEKKILMGALIFLIGLLKYMGQDWSVILMIVGVLIVLKGILIKK